MGLEAVQPVPASRQVDDIGLPDAVRKRDKLLEMAPVNIEGKSVLLGLPQTRIAVIVPQGKSRGSCPLREETHDALVVTVSQTDVVVPSPLLALNHLGVLLCDGKSVGKHRGVLAAHLESDHAANQLLGLALRLRHCEMSTERRVAPAFLRLLIVFQQEHVAPLDLLEESVGGARKGHAGVAVQDGGALLVYLGRVLEEPELPRKVLRIPKRGIGQLLGQGKRPHMGGPLLPEDVHHRGGYVGPHVDVNLGLGVRQVSRVDGVQGGLRIRGIGGRHKDTLLRRRSHGRRRQRRQSRWGDANGTCGHCCLSGLSGLSCLSIVLCGRPRWHGRKGFSRRLAHNTLGDFLHRPLYLEDLELGDGGNGRHRLPLLCVDVRINGLDAFQIILPRLALIHIEKAAAVKVAVHVGVAPIQRDAARNLGVKHLLRRVARFRLVFVGDGELVVLVEVHLGEFTSAAAEARGNRPARQITKEASPRIDGLVGREGVEGLVPLRVRRVRRHKGTKLGLALQQLGIHANAVLEGHGLGVHEPIHVGSEPVDFELPQGKANVVLVRRIIKAEMEKGVGSLAFLRALFLTGFARKIDLGHVRILVEFGAAERTVEDDLRRLVVEDNGASRGPAEQEGKEVVGRLKVGPHFAKGDAKGCLCICICYFIKSSRSSGHPRFPHILSKGKGEQLLCRCGRRSSRSRRRPHGPCGL